MDHEAGGNIQAVTDTSKMQDCTVQDAEKLIAFVEAALSRDEGAMGPAREELRRAVGSAGLVDAAGVVGNFERMNRTAAAGGLELDAPIRTLGANVRDELGLDNLASASRVKPASGLSKLIARFAIPIAARIYGKPD